MECADLQMSDMSRDRSILIQYALQQVFSYFLQPKLFLDNNSFIHVQIEGYARF